VLDPEGTAACARNSGRAQKDSCSPRNPATPDLAADREVQDIYAALREHHRVEEQGFGRPIISRMVDGQRVIAAGSEAFTAEGSKSFRDFLYFYIKCIFSHDWFAAEEAKPIDHRHPLVQWLIEQRQYLASSDNPRTLQLTSLCYAYLNLSYNLYLIAHNNGAVHQLLIQRLKKTDQFLGAYYEAFVTGAMIRAGFDIALEDETDSTRSHCEFTATYRKTGQKYSVEAKLRRSKKHPPDICDQLHKALRKHAQHARIVFIELNLAVERKAALGLLANVFAIARQREHEIKVDGQPAPPAYVFVTNCPIGSIQTERTFTAVADAFRMPDFQGGRMPGNFHEALEWRARHRGVLDLAESLVDHLHVPRDFEGYVSSTTVTEPRHRFLRIGESCSLMTQAGEFAGVLIAAAVLVAYQEVMCCVRQVDGLILTIGVPLTGLEIQTYYTSPDTFFGVRLGPPGEIYNPFKLYDWLLECHRQNSKEHFLTRLFRGAHDIEDLKHRSQEELAQIYAERTTQAVLIPNSRLKCERVR
jgi:hypothetical protein